MLKQLLAGIVALVVIGFAFGAGSTLAVFPFRAEPAAVIDSANLVNIDENTIIGTSAILYDPQDGEVLYQKNDQAQLPLASLTKLMTAQAVLATRDPATEITITKDDLAPDGDWGFEVGDIVSLGDLLRFGLVVSSNDAMAAAASSLGSGYLDAMNAQAERLGLTRTYFLNSTGLDLSDDQAGAYGSAYDVARMAAGFFHDYPALFEQTTFPSASIEVGGRTLSATATSLPLQDMPGFIAGKTGYTDLAGGNLVAVFDLAPNRPVIAVVLHSTEEGRYSDIRTIIETARLTIHPQ